MTREWQPGDVALVNDCTRPEEPWKAATCHAVRTPERETVWVLHDTGGKVWGSVSDARPLVVIDPEDSEQVERLWRIWITLAPDHLLAQDNMQAALREFANPKPPKPEEPTDPAVRVRANGSVWAKCGPWWVTPALDESPREWDYLVESDDYEVVQP